MGVCSSNKNNTLDSYEWRKKTSRIVIILENYQKKNMKFSNINKLCLNRDMIRLKNFAKNKDPFIHYNGKCQNKKKQLHQYRISLDNNELIFLDKLWHLYLITQKFIDWRNISKIHNQENVYFAIQKFLNIRQEIINILETIEKI